LDFRFWILDFGFWIGGNADLVMVLQNEVMQVQAKMVSASLNTQKAYYAVKHSPGGCFTAQWAKPVQTQDRVCFKAHWNRFSGF
jgi:hypothetical protein